MRPSHTHFPHYVSIEARKIILSTIKKILRNIIMSLEGHFPFLEEEFPLASKIIYSYFVHNLH